MKGLVFLGNRRLDLREFQNPVPGPGEVVVRLQAAAICGSDLHFYRSKPEHMKKPFMIAGHEGAGTVYSTGEGVERVQPGDRVCVYHYLSCGACYYCRKGDKMLCGEGLGLGYHVNGTDADYVLVREENCLPLPAELSFIDGVFISCIAGTAFSALKKLDLTSGETIVVFGLGPVGLTVALLARAMGVRTIGIEINPHRIDLAQRIGIEQTINIRDRDCVQALRNLTNGYGPDKIVETSGSVRAQRDAVESARPQGSVILVGVQERSEEGRYLNEMNPISIIAKELTVRGSYVMPIRYYPELAELLAAKNVNLQQIVTHRYPLDSAKLAMDTFDKGDTGKIIFEFQ